LLFDRLIRLDSANVAKGARPEAADFNMGFRSAPKAVAPSTQD